MRSLTELMDDLARLDGRRFDETVFEILHRGARSIERLRSFASQLSPRSKAKIGQSVAAVDEGAGAAEPRPSAAGVLGGAGGRWVWDRLS